MKNKTDHKFWTLIILGSVIIVLAVLFVSIKAETSNQKSKMRSTMTYIKDQYSMYNRFNDATEAKSLIRMIENVQQVSRDLKEDAKKTTKRQLKMYAQEQKLDGIVVFGSNGKQEVQYHKYAKFQKIIRYTMQKDTLKDVQKYPQKSYVTRINLKDGAYIDLASYGRRDHKGIVVGYEYVPAEYAKNYSLTIQNVLAGYKVDNDGTIVITNENSVVASNDKKLINTQAPDHEMIREIRKRAKTGEFVVIQKGLKRYFASLDKGRNYYIYMYAQDINLAKTLVNNIGIAIILYAIFVTILMMIKERSNQQYEQIQREREEEYKKELEKSAREAQKANIAKTEFLQRMSHDIRTPINGIRGMVEVGDYYKDDLNKQAECRQKIWEASGFLLELINEVLDMGKLESEEVLLEERSFNFFELFKEIRMVIEKQARERGIRILVHKYKVIHEDLIGSPVHVKRVLMNILTNAIKYNKDNGKISMEFEEIQEDQDIVILQFKCEDTGIGMSKSFQKRIFEPFAQEKAGARTVYGGTGLGMPITKSLVEKMGGNISFESEQGVGTTFYIEIPFHIDHNAKYEEHKETKTKEQSIEGINVLVAEDNELNMEIVEFVLQSAGAKVIKAFNGEEAVEIFKSSKTGEIDIILMDVMMPVMDGIEAAQYIRWSNKENAKDIPIIAMTANAFTEDRRRVLEAGMNEHLAKPLESDVLVETIANYCGK